MNYKDTADAQAPTAFSNEVLALLLGFNGTNFDRLRALADNADAQAPATLGALLALARGEAFNGTSYDRLRTNLSNISLATLTAQGAASNQSSADQVNYNGRGVKVVIDITGITGTGPSLTVTIQGKDPVSGKYYTILASAALAAAATTVLTVYPGLTAAANAAANDALPRDWRIIWTVAGTGPSVTATIAASIIN